MKNQMKTFILMTAEYFFFILLSLLLLIAANSESDDGAYLIAFALCFLKVFFSTIMYLVRTIKFFVKKMVNPVSKTPHLFGLIVSVLLFVTLFDLFNVASFFVCLVMVGGEIVLLVLSGIFTKKIYSSPSGRPAPVGTLPKAEEKYHVCEYCGTAYEGEKCPGCGARYLPYIKKDSR